MDNKPSITYIKKGKEKTIKHFFEYNFKKEIGKVEDRIYYQDYYINQDIEYIHFKNIKFIPPKGPCEIIKLKYKNPNMLIILENCYFKTNEFLIEPYFTISTGIGTNIQIINPILIKETEFKINYTNSVDINLIDENYFLNLNIRDCKNVNLCNLNKINQLRLFEINKAYIKNLNTKTTKIYFYDIESMTLENSIITNYYYYLYIQNLHLKNSTIESKNKLSFYSSKLILENSKIISDDSIKISELKEIIFIDDDKSILDNSSYLQAETEIELGKKNLKRHHIDNPLIITKEDLETNLSIKRQELLFVLKSLSNILNKEINKEVKEKKEYFKNEIKILKQEQKKELKKIVEEKEKQQRQVIDERKQENKKALNEYETYLLTKKIGTPMKKR